jgi:heme/copper-type cytochrome/quinol oxidase subunit 3
MATKRDPMLWPAIALVVTQVVHGAVPVDENHPENEGYTGLVVGGIFLLLSVIAVVQLAQHRPSGRALAGWTGLAVGVGFVAYHAVPWTSAISNPYLGQPVGAPAWITVFLSVGAGFWCAWDARTLLGTRLGLYRPASAT